MRLTQKQLDRTLTELERIVNEYKAKYTTDDKRDWRTYEQRLALRMRKACDEIEPIVNEAYSMIAESGDPRGRPPKVPVPKKVLILLMKEIFQLSNRRMSNMIMLFTFMTGICLSYKTVERAYSEPMVSMTIHNMFTILAKRKGITETDASGDGTGYSLTVTKHYCTERGKELKGKDIKRKAFTYAFAMMDIDTRMYIGYGTSMRSEKEAFIEALGMARDIGVTIKSVRLDKYYSHQSITEEFGEDTAIYVIPKKNATIRGSPEWKSIIRSLVTDPFTHLHEYYKRNMSENGFFVDKLLCGWRVIQRRADRIFTATICKGVWHNLMLIG